MRIASYNHMFGCNGRSLSEFLHVTAAHKLKSYDYVERTADLEQTASTVRESNADIVAIMEVLGSKQREKLMDVLRVDGYKNFHVGNGHGLGQKYGGNVETLLATRMPSDSIYTPDFQVPDELGYGGGVVGVHISDQNLYVIQVHLPLRVGKTRDCFQEQLGSVLNEVERVKRRTSDAKIVVMGDFNSSYNDLIRLHPEFEQFQRLSADTVTCSTTNFLRWFYRKDLDHILGIGLAATGAGVIEGASDHKLVWVDLKV